MSKITDLFLECMYERNHDRTINLMLHGHILEKNKRIRIGSSDVELVGNHLRSKSNIVALQLCYNNIGDEGVRKLAYFLMDCANLKYLDLRMNGIGVDGVQSLVNFKEKLTLKSINLAGNKFGKQGGILISELISVNSHLQHLDLSETDQTSTSIAYLLSAIAENTTLKNFNLSRVVGPPGHAFDVEHFADLLGRVLNVNSSIRELHLQKTHLTDHEVEWLCDGLRSSESLEMLDLSCNLFGDQGISVISDWLLTKPILKALSLSHNRITDGGAISLARSLAFSRIRYLDLSFNKIQDSGILSLLFLMPKHATKLQLLFLRGNVIENVETLNMMQRLIEAGIIDSKTFDLELYHPYGDTPQLSVAYNYLVDTFKEDYYLITREQSIKEKLSRRKLHFVKSWPLPLSLIDKFDTPFLD